MKNKYKVGETLIFKDLALGLLFPSYWDAYRVKCSKENVFKLKIAEIDGKEYKVILMEVSPIDGRVIIPNGIYSFINDKKIDIALKYMDRSLIDQIDEDIDEEGDDEF